MLRPTSAAPLTFALLAFLASGPAAALSAAEVFEKVSPSVWAVRGVDGSGRPFSFGSGVVIGRGRLITNCHVLAKAKSIQVVHANVSYGAKLEHADAERDLCTLSVANFYAPAVAKAPQSQLKVGQRVYAIGNPINLELTLSEGLISGLRTESSPLPTIQTSAPISPGSSGGGLFDEQGRLVGITTLIVLGRERIAQNLNFAAPADWIDEVPERATEQLARLRESKEKAALPSAASTPSSGSAQDPAAKALPPVGSHWSYTVRDRGHLSASWDFSVVLTSVNGSTVTETLSSASGQEVLGFDARSIAFAVRRMKPDMVVELSPYLLAFLPSPALPLKTPYGYIGPASDWDITVSEIAREPVAVRAGKFDAVRIKVTGENPRIPMGRSQQGLPQRFEYTVWYAPEAARYVQAHHRVLDVYGIAFSDQWVELVDFRTGDASGH